MHFQICKAVGYISYGRSMSRLRRPTEKPITIGATTKTISKGFSAMTKRRDSTFETTKPKTSLRSAINNNQSKSNILRGTYDAAQEGNGIADNRHSHNHQQKHRLPHDQRDNGLNPQQALIENENEISEDCLQGLSPLSHA